MFKLRLLPVRSVFSKAAEITTREEVIQQDKHTLSIEVVDAISSQENTILAITEAYNKSMKEASNVLTSLQILQSDLHTS